MTQPARTQNVLAPPAASAIFLVVTVREGSEAETRDLLADVAGLTRAVGFRAPDDPLSLVVGIGSALWDRLYGAARPPYAGPRPAELHPFEPLEGPTHTAPSTPGDLLFHLRARRIDLCFELARHLTDRLAGHADVVDEVHGFRYFDERDLLGFVDGTENPEGEDAVEAVTVGDEDPQFRGGSYVVVQKYLHDLDAWEALPVEEQERVIGRHKLSDIEFDDDDKPSNSHVVLNTIEDEDGNDLDIVRDNMAFGSVATGDFGTYFIGYAASPDVIERMLRNMFLGDPPGNHDRILDFSTAATGGLFFVPPVDFLEDPTVVTATEQPSETASEEPAGTDDSLGIGSMRRSTP